MPDRPKYTPWFTGAAPPRARSAPVRATTPATPSAPPQPVLAPAPVETTTGPSDHPEAVKARRWRGRRRLQRQGHVIVEVAVSPAQLRGLHALGLVSGTPWVRATPPTPDSVAQAISSTAGCRRSAFQGRGSAELEQPAVRTARHAGCRAWPIDTSDSASGAQRRLRWCLVGQGRRTGCQGINGEIRAGAGARTGGEVRSTRVRREQVAVGHAEQADPSGGR